MSSTFIILDLLTSGNILPFFNCRIGDYEGFFIGCYGSNTMLLLFFVFIL